MPMNRILHILFTLLLLTSSAAPTLYADEVDDAVAAARKAPKNQKLNRKAAEALREAGRTDEAITYFLKSDNRGNLDAARLCFDLYEFNRASELLDRYEAKRTKEQAREDAAYTDPDTGEQTDITDLLRTKILLGQSMIDRVEQIQIIDSITVAADDFFRFYKIASTAGSLQSAEWVERLLPRDWMKSAGLENLSSMAYVSEGSDYVIFAASDSEGATKMYETGRLSDGSWESPREIFDYNGIFNSDEGSVVEFPFLMSDGISLYFAADGAESLGGLDIFITRRDNDTYLQPSNIGMPYNSPYNDYMYAVDEVTGTGWWATDRNNPGSDSITVYTFIPQNDLRINYPADMPGLTDLARVSTISRTQPVGADYSDLKARIAAIKPSVNRASEREFSFSLPDGRIITSLDGFRNQAARKAMEQLLDAEGVDKANRRQLEELREHYAGGDHKLSFRILDLEEKVEKAADDRLRLSNRIVELETGK